MLCIIRALLQTGMVVKFWPQNLYFSPGYTEALQDIGVEVAYGGGADTFREWLAENGDDLDHVLLCRPQVAAAFLPELKRHGGISLLYYGADLHFSRMRQEAKELDDRCIARQARDMEMLERSVWRDVDVVLYPSDEETAVVTDIEPDVVARTLLPYSFADFASPRPPNAEPVILFVGGFAHQPNRHGLLWFIDQVLPLILARVPAARLTIAGSNPPAGCAGVGQRCDQRARECQRCRTAGAVSHRARRRGAAALRRRREAEGGGGVARGVAAGHHLDRCAGHAGP